MEEMSEYNIRSFDTSADYYWNVVLEFQCKTFQLLRVVIVAVEHPYYIARIWFQIANRRIKKRKRTCNQTESANQPLYIEYEACSKSARASWG